MMELLGLARVLDFGITACHDLGGGGAIGMVYWTMGPWAFGVRHMVVEIGELLVV